MRARTNSRQDPGSRMFAESRWPARRGNRVTEGVGGAEVDADPRPQSARGLQAITGSARFKGRLPLRPRRARAPRARTPGLRASSKGARRNRSAAAASRAPFGFRPGQGEAEVEVSHLPAQRGLESHHRQRAVQGARTSASRARGGIDARENVYPNEAAPQSRMFAESRRVDAEEPGDPGLWASRSARPGHLPD